MVPSAAEGYMVNCAPQNCRDQVSQLRSYFGRLKPVRKLMTLDVNFSGNCLNFWTTEQKYQWRKSYILFIKTW